MSSPSRPLCQQPERAPDRGERGAQLVADDREELVLHPVDLLALGHVAEDHHGPAQLVLVDHRAGGDLDGERRAVGPHVDVLLTDHHDPAADRLRDVAARPREGQAVLVGGVEGVVRLPAVQVLGGVAERLGRRRVHEGDPAVVVDAVDPVTHRGEQHLGLAGQAPQVGGLLADPPLEAAAQRAVVGGQEGLPGAGGDDQHQPHHRLRGLQPVVVAEAELDTDGDQEDAEHHQRAAGVREAALRPGGRVVQEGARHPRCQPDGQVAGDPAQVERRAEVEAVLLGQDGEGEVGDGVQDEAAGDQREHRPVGAAGAQHQQQGHGRQHHVERREEQGERRYVGARARVEQPGVDEHGGDDHHRDGGDDPVERHHEQVQAAPAHAREVEQAGDGEQQRDRDADLRHRARGGDGVVAVGGDPQVAEDGDRPGHHEQPPGPPSSAQGLGGAHAAADRRDDAGEQQPGAARGLADTGGDRVAEQQGEDAAEAERHRRGHGEAPPLDGERRGPGEGGAVCQ